MGQQKNMFQTEVEIYNLLKKEFRVMINKMIRDSLVIQWLWTCASTIEGTGLIPGQGTKIIHATWLT